MMFPCSRLVSFYMFREAIDVSASISMVFDGVLQLLKYMGKSARRQRSTKHSAAALQSLKVSGLSVLECDELVTNGDAMRLIN